MKRLPTNLLMAALCLCLTAGTAESVRASGQESSGYTPGDKISGFTLESTEHSSLLNSDVLSFRHDYSGAQLVYVSNSDTERAFGIGFKTPYVDETDTNHVFEHAILAGSEKYPSKDIFFDMANKAYATYTNAFTTFTTTVYPVASQDEDQLLKMADVYMSCMAAPAILSEENFFKREAIRYELSDPESEISINGTVFAEDTGYMTDQWNVAAEHILDTLYPGEIASNYLGKAEYHYDDLTYEHTLETYERCYHFDNSLIFLYGDLNLERFLEFLDTEYLSQQERYGTDLSQWEDPLTEAGYEEAVLPIPAYEGDTTEDNSVITYTVDLQDASREEIMVYSIMASLLNLQSAPLQQLAIRNNIQNPVYVNFNMEPKPFLTFYMYYANEDQMQELKNLVEGTLDEVLENGLAPELISAVVKNTERNTLFLRNQANVGVDLVSTFVHWWELTGNTDYYSTFEDILYSLEGEEGQEAIRNAASVLRNPRRSALIASVPTPGLAEEHDEEMARYLADMKASMSDEEIAQMIADTEAFNAWNEEEMPNNDFLIDPASLEPLKEEGDFTVFEQDGITVYAGTADVEGGGVYRLYFDLEGMTKEEIETLMLYQSLLFEMDTDIHTAEELNLLTIEYLNGPSFSLSYPNEGAGENHRPMLRMEWSGLTEDFEVGLNLILNVLTSTDLSQHDMMSYLLWRDADAWDMSRQDGMDIASMAASAGAGLSADTNRFEMDADGQDAYYMIADMVDHLTSDENYPEVLQEQFETARKKAFTNSRLIFMSVTGEGESQAVAESAEKILSALPAKESAEAAYELPEWPQKSAICIEASQNYTYMVGDYMADPEFKGRYLPFVSTVNDKITVPVFRFQLGAYSAGSGLSTNSGIIYSYTYSDPNVRKTVETLESLADEAGNLSLTPEELDGYILNAYAGATYPIGTWNTILNRMGMTLLGCDTARRTEIINDIRNAVPEDLAEAAEHIGTVISTSTIATVGNEAMIRADEDVFDSVVSYRHADTADADEETGEAEETAEADETAEAEENAEADETAEAEETADTDDAAETAEAEENPETEETGTITEAGQTEAEN